MVANDTRVLELATIAPADYERDVLPRSESLWANGRSFDEYVSDFQAVVASSYGRRRFRTVGLKIEGVLVASLKRYERDLLCAGRILRAVGIGAVFTPEGFRGRGYASAMLGAFLDREHAAGSDIAYLFSDIHPAFYERLGFITLPSRSMTLRADSLPNERIKADALADGDWPAIARTYASIEGGSRLTLRRTPVVWEYLRLRAQSHDRQGGSVRLGVRKGRSIIAYVTGRREPRADAFVVDEAVYAGDEGRAVFAALLRNAAGDLRKITGWLPPSPIREALPRGAVRRRRDAIAMMVPLSAAAREGWRSQSASLLTASSDLYWSADHV